MRIQLTPEEIDGLKTWLAYPKKVRRGECPFVFVPGNTCARICRMVFPGDELGLCPCDQEGADHKKIYEVAREGAERGYITIGLGH